MFPFRKKEEELYARGNEARPSRSEIKKMLRTVPENEAFNFYEGVGKPTGHKASSLVDFREEINAVGLRSLIFHLRRRDFERWIREVVGDWKLAERIGRINLNSYDLQVRLYTVVSKRIKNLNEMLSTSTVTFENFEVAPPFSKTESVG